MKAFAALQTFRNNVYTQLPVRRDANMNLLDSLSSYGHRCKTVIELSEAPCFTRQYSSITDGIADGLSHVDWNKMTKTVYSAVQSSQDRVVLIPDCTPGPRPYSRTLPDRHMTYSPNPAPGNNPVCVGHQYSVIGLQAQYPKTEMGHWLIPLSVKRVNSTCKGNEVGIRQITECIQTLGLEEKLVLSIGDSLYGTEACRKEVLEHDNWVHLFRLNSTRNIYASAKASDNKRLGNTTRYGKAMKLNVPSSHSAPDTTEEFSSTTSRDKQRTVIVKSWCNQLFRGSRSFKSYTHPMRVFQITVKDASGQSIYKRPLWLSIIGKRGDEITAKEAYEYYTSRYDIEHYFRFGKDKLLLDAYQTPDMAHEEDWWRLNGLAYAQLYLARKSVALLPKKWERYLPSYRARQETSAPIVATPSQTQRGFSQVLDVIGTPAKACIPRGKSKGRQRGEFQIKRPVHPIHFKNSSSKKPDKYIFRRSGKSVDLSDPKKMKKFVAEIKSNLQKFDFTPEKFFKLLKQLE